MTRLRIAAAQYPLDRLPGIAAWRDKMDRWVAEAARAGAQLLVFPEYGSLELTALAGVDGDLARQTDALQDLWAGFQAHVRDLARRHGVYLLAPSFPVREAGRVRNAALFAGPDGRLARQDKLIPTRWEREDWDLAGGDAVRVFDTPWGPVGVSICYDVEFPLIARAQAEAGAVLILAPSCTDTAAGWHRVRVGAAARALESQCYVVQAPTVGPAPWCAAVDSNTGAAAVYAPPDRGMPEDGVVAMGRRDEPGWVHAELDLSLVDDLRVDGTVLNHFHWPEQLYLGPATMADWE